MSELEFIDPPKPKRVRKKPTTETMFWVYPTEKRPGTTIFGMEATPTKEGFLQVTATIEQAKAEKKRAGKRLFTASQYKHFIMGIE